MSCKRALSLLGIAIFALCTVGQGQNAVQTYWSENYGVSIPAPDGKFYQFSRLAKAQPDECFDSNDPLGSKDSFIANYPNNLDLSNVVNGDCFNSLTNHHGQLKTNQAYLWGFTSWGHDLWFGTVANTLCLVVDQMSGNNANPLTMNTVDCRGVDLDARPPRIFLYETKTGQLSDMTNQVYNSTNPLDRFNLLHTAGLRSAGSLGDVVFLGGIAYDASLNPAITMFAFNGRTKTFIGSILYSSADSNNPYSNIRQWLVTNNNLYVGVAGPAGNALGFGTESGFILRWTGTTTDPFHFETVGRLNADPAYLARYQNRLFVTTWGGNGTTNPYKSDTAYGTQLFMSPNISKISTSTAGDWQVVWKYSDYEVEPSAAMGGGALSEHDGWLYWTTMVPPGVQAATFGAMYQKSPATIDVLGSYRPTVMFRGKFLDTKSPTIQLLYGNTFLPKYNKGSDQWSIVPNNMKGAPGIYGHAGYGNPFNSYTWWMNVYNGELFIGTFDWSYLIGESLFDQYQFPPEVVAAARKFEGADLLRIHSSNDPAYIVSLDGVGNFSNYGVRNMLQLGSQMYIGTANPFNLLNPPINENYQYQLGGWELLHMKPTSLWYQTYCVGYSSTTMPSYCVPPVG